MGELTLTYRDIDRAPYLYALKHMAEKYGTVLNLVRADIRGPYPEFLLEGKTDVLCENYWGLQNFRARGERWIAVATAVTTLNEKLFVHPSVNKVSDLRGKKFAIRKTGPSQLIPQLWLRDNGLADVETVIYSEDETGRWGTWKKVVDGTCHGCFITNFYQDDPRGAGLKELDIEPYGFIGNVTLTTTEEIAKTRMADVQNMVDAAFDASDLFRKDPDAVLAIFKASGEKLRDYEGDAELRKIFAILTCELSVHPIPSADGISNTRRMTLFNGPELKDFNTIPMWDMSFARAALNRRKIA
jgi:ABC-type nitrate/sulfonate/bicarbonate transport system substrate-binding protein